MTMRKLMSMMMKITTKWMINNSATVTTAEMRISNRMMEKMKISVIKKKKRKKKEITLTKEMVGRKRRMNQLTKDSLPHRK